MSSGILLTSLIAFFISPHAHSLGVGAGVYGGCGQECKKRYQREQAEEEEIQQMRRRQHIEEQRETNIVTINDKPVSLWHISSWSNSTQQFAINHCQSTTPNQGSTENLFVFEVHPELCIFGDRKVNLYGESKWYMLSMEKPVASNDGGGWLVSGMLLRAKYTSIDRGDLTDEIIYTEDFGEHFITCTAFKKYNYDEFPIKIGWNLVGSNSAEIKCVE